MPGLYPVLITGKGALSMAAGDADYFPKKSGRRFTSLLLFLMIFVFSAIPDDFSFISAAASLSEDDLEIWYDRSDLEESRDVWLSSINYGTSFLSSEERERALAGTKNRLASWQWKKVKEQIALPDIQALLSEIENKKKDYLYLMEEGNPSFDENGKPVFKGLADIDTDIASWEGELKDFINNLFDNWEQRAKIRYDEILSFEKNIGESERAMLDVSFSKYKESIKREFEYLYLAGRKNLVAWRSKDSFSMKKESEDKSASAEAEKRISEVQITLKDASSLLEKNLSVLKSLNSEEAVLKVSEWEDDFRDSFEKGLSKWERAEKDFLSERIRWEREGKDGYIKAEKEWDRAIEKFTEARSAWSSEMKEIINEGREYWQEREEKFFNSYKDVTAGIEEASLKEKIRFEKEINGYLSVYRESRNIERMSDKNIGYLKGEIKRIEEYKKDKQRIISRIGSEIKEIEKEVRKLKSLGDSNFGRFFLKKALEKEKLLPELREQYNLAEDIRDKKNDELSSYITELAFWEKASYNYKTARENAEKSLLALEDKIKSGVYGENEFDSEVEILKEKRDILKHKLDVAQLVYEYSLDKTSDRERKSETEKRYREALLIFKEKKSLYETSISELDDFIENILSGNEKEIEEKKSSLLAAENKLEEARKEYEAAMEIFRLKDSSLLEITISNLEEENDSYLENDLENIWSEYFLHMEKLLRNERVWAADELSADIKGTSADDNAEDISILKTKMDFLDNLDSDFSDSDTSVLENEFILKGFDMENCFVDKFFSSLEEGNKEESEFYLNLVKIMYKSEFASVDKGLELLSLKESEKSVSELTSEMEVILEEKRKDLLGNNYRDDDILLFFDQNSFYESDMDLSDSEVIEKIKEIALLEAELKAIEKYSSLSPAFILHEREELLENLKKLFCIADDGSSLSVGLGPSLEKRDDLIEFYNNLKKYNVPVYIEEITGKILQSVLKDSSFIFNDDLSSVENRFNLLSGRIENYTSSDPLPLSELEEERDELFLKLETLTDLNRYYALSLESSFSEKEKRIYENLAVKALQLMKEEPDIVTVPDIVKEKRSIIDAEEIKYKERKRQLAELREKLRQWETEQGKYFTENIADKKALLESAKDIVNTLRVEYHDLLDSFTSLTDVYRLKKEAVDKALFKFNESRWVLYEAEELKDFAHSPYPLKNADPYSILEIRKADFEKTDNLYNEILNIKNSLEEYPVSERFSIEYLKALEEKKEVVSGVNYIGYAEEILSRNISKAINDAGRYYAVMKDSFSGIFSFNVPFSPDLESYKNRELTDFTEYKSEEEIKSAVFDYFSGKDASTVFSNDTLIWAEALSSDEGSSILRNFGIAFYAEYKDKVSVPVYSDQNYQQLKRGKYADCNPEKYADSFALNILSSIKNDRQLYRLYSFFRAMHLSGNTSLDYSFMGKDVSRIAHDYLWNESKKEEKHIKRKHWWKNFWKRTAKKMSKMRHNMADVNGNSERGIILGDIGKIFSARSSYLLKKDEIRILTGGEEGKAVSFDDFLTSLDAVCGGLPEESGPGFKGILENIYNSLADEDKSSSYTISSEIFGKLKILLNSKTDMLNIITASLEKKRENLRLEYSFLLNNPDASSDTVKSCFTDLFYNSEYSRHESAEISLAEIFSSFSDGKDLVGRERTLLLASDELVKLFSSSVDIQKRKNDELMKLQYLEMKDNSKLFETRISELFETGLCEWKNSFADLAGKRKSWREDFRKESELKEKLWRDKYSILKENRGRWIDESVNSLKRGEMRRLALEIGINADRLLAESEMIIIPDIKNAPSLENIVEEVTSSQKLSTLITAAGYYSSRKESDNIILSSYLPETESFGWSGTSLESFASNLSGEVRKRAALLQALQLAETVNEVEDGISENIESANRSTDKFLSDLLEGKGYRKRGNIFSRKAVIDMTLLGGIEEELHEIESYNYFTAPGFETGVDLSRSSLSSMSGREIELKVQKAVADLKRYSDLIFGRKTSKDASEWKGFDEEFKSYVKNTENSFASSKQASKYIDTKGLFYMHLGYAPVMKSKSPEKVKTEGYGEYGRIYRLYFRNEARLGRGLASFDVPWYSQKLWDDDRNNDGKSDGLFGAPTVRGLGNIAMSVVSGGAGAWAFAVNMIDDAAFTAMDIGSGITDWDEGLMNIGKQTASGGIAQGIGSGFRIETDSFFASSAAAGLKTASVNLAGTAVNSFALSSGGIYFSSDSFEKNWKSDLYGKEAVSGYISSMGTAGLNSTLTGFYGSDLRYGQALSSSIAGAAAGIYEYNTLGRTRLNVLNTKDFGSGNTGLLELSIGDGGSLFNFGTEGHNASASRISDAYKGINTYYQNMRIYSSEQENIRSAAVGMRALYSRGSSDTKAEELYRNFLSGRDRLEIDRTLEGNAETVKNESGGRTIKISASGDDYYSRLQLGIVLGHEARRDGVISGFSSQAEETIASVFAHSRMAVDMERDYKGLIASDKMLIDDVNRYNEAVMRGDLNSFAAHVIDYYDISKDYWKVIKHKDGSITMTDDGSDDVAVLDEETGEEEIFKYSGGSKTGFIADTLGLSRDEVNYRMGPEAGWTYKNGKWVNNLDDKTVGFTAEQVEKMNIRFRELNLIKTSSRVNEGVFRKIGNAVEKGRSWISGKYAVVREMFNFKRYIASKTVPGPLSDKYYRRGNILPSEIISGGEISQTAHAEDTHLLEDWYTKGHPAVDVTGKGMISFPYDLELMKTGKNRNRLLYRIAGSEDYIYFTHINPSESDALQKILEKSGSTSVLYKAGSSLFSYPVEVDDYSTDLHVHMEMYRKKDDGTYSFADPLTGEFLPDYEYMFSDDGKNYGKWRMKLPYVKRYWN